ncbi:LysR family transcriptional regulator [Haloechinothrix sp. LS1_15]|uniref:LysR family transcriptional regulator n=1 Tax=Haloechinothrix sp. LS1_15 TaxID=2652248 RepID=UPI002946E559|nr:LysR family transcriptional regulator [Haloechinothrix sp. LS1_15]MDV6013705.1 LysR family transcriptional regulator [Haloechinothrix sp. LS1_15]
MIDSRLHVLRLLAHHGTVTATAGALNYTPSAVSHQLRQLSRELGVPLLSQRGRRVVLTSAARALLEHADVLFTQWERARAELTARAGEVTGTVGLCGFSTVAAPLLPEVARALTERYPRLRTTVIEAEPEECYSLLLAGEADLAVVVLTPTTPPTSDARFDQRPLIDEPLDLQVHREHRFAHRASISLADAAAEPWIVARPGTAFHQLVLGACAQAGFAPAVAHYSNDWDTGTALVAAGFGVALVSRLARWSGEHDVVRVPLHGDPPPSRRVLVVTRAGAGESPPLGEALDVLDSAARRVLASTPRAGV